MTQERRQDPLLDAYSNRNSDDLRGVYEFWCGNGPHCTLVWDLTWNRPEYRSEHLRHIATLQLLAFVITFGNVRSVLTCTCLSYEIGCCSVLLRSVKHQATKRLPKTSFGKCHQTPSPTSGFLCFDACYFIEKPFSMPERAPTLKALTNLLIYRPCTSP